MRTGIIYCATSPSGKKYIGRTIQTIDKRKYSHNSRSRTGSLLYFHNAIRKHGEKNISWKIIESYMEEDPKLLIDKLNEREISIINDLGTMYPNGYNLNKGGGSYTAGLKPRTGKTFEEIFGQKKAAEIKAKMSIGLKGKTLGRKQSREEIEKRALSNTGKTRTLETKEKTRNSLLGIKHTQERKKNISEALKKSDKLKGKNNPAYIEISDTTKDLIRDLHVNQGFGSRIIEKQTGISFGRILKFLREEGIYKPKYKNHK